MCCMWVIYCTIKLLQCVYIVLLSHTFTLFFIDLHSHISISILFYYISSFQVLQLADGPDEVHMSSLAKHEISIQDPTYKSRR